MRFGLCWTISLDYWLSPGKVTRLETVAGQGQQQLIDSFLSFLSRDCLIAVDLVNLGAGLGYFRVYYEGGLPLPWIVHIFQGDSTLLWLLMTLTNWNQGEGGISASSWRGLYSGNLDDSLFLGNIFELVLFAFLQS